jgi:hypothetical protein
MPDDHAAHDHDHDHDAGTDHDVHYHQFDVLVDDLDQPIHHVIDLDDPCSDHHCSRVDKFFVHGPLSGRPDRSRTAVELHDDNPWNNDNAAVLDHIASIYADTAVDDRGDDSDDLHRH